MSLRNLVHALIVLLSAVAACERHGGVIAARLPRVVHQGGPFLRKPEVTTVTFEGDEPAIVTRLERFGDVITTSPWWHQVVEGYCVQPGDCMGDGHAGQHIHLAALRSLELRDVDVELMLRAQASVGLLSKLGPDALVLVYLPPRVILKDASNPHYCDDGPRAYHRMLRINERSIAYAVVARCDDEAEPTRTASHEVLEAATNPDPQNHGFSLSPGPKTGAFAAAGVEPADPCGLLALNKSSTRDSGFAVERAWSNREAQAGRDPCVPSSNEGPYVALVPRTPTVRLASVGARATVLLDAASDRAVSSWFVAAVDVTGQQDGEQFVEARLDRRTVNVGDVAVLTLRLVNVHPRRMSIVEVISTTAAGSHMWPIAISMR